MSSSRRKHRPGLPGEVQERLALVLQRREMTEPELDGLLAHLEADHFEDQLRTLIGELGTCPLTVGHRTTTALPGAASQPLPSGGRVSKRYLADIKRFPGMTREEEVESSRRMEFVTARLEAAEFQTRKERHRRRDEYNLVRTRFVERNLHLVVSHAYAYRTYGVPLDDLIQEGNAALIRACEKFDWRHEVRFKTYVAYWVRQAIERSLASQKGAVRVPHHLQQKFRRLKREGKLPRHRDEDLSVDQVAEAFEMKREAASHLLESSRTSFSLEQTLTPDGDSYRDFLFEHWEPVEQDRRELLRNRLEALLDGLDQREQRILALRFGLLDGEEATLEQVGQDLSLSRERSRQIQQKALRKLRRAAEESRLTDFL